MSQLINKTLEEWLSAAGLQELNAWIEKYPSHQRQSAVMAALRIAQEEQGFLTTEIMEAIALYLDMPPVSVCEVATFYSMYKFKPCGRHTLNVCTSISCKLRGAHNLIHDIENSLHIKVNETTADNRFTLKTVQCLGACIGAPVMQVDKDYHEYVTKEKVAKLLEHYS